MKNRFQRAIALLLSAVLCVGLLAGLAASASAQDENLKKGTFRYAPHTVLNTDLEDYYYYSDAFFKGSALDYNEHLATMSMILAASSISSQDTDADYDEKSRNLAQLMVDLEFANFKVNDDYTEEPGEQTMGVGLAYRVIGEGKDAFTVLAIVPRSAGYKKEWAGNFTVGKNTVDKIGDKKGLHEGFTTGRDVILDYTKKYVEYYRDSFVGDVKIWTVGYSRGAGVANLVAASLVDNAKDAIGLELKQENIFAYTFGTPSSVQYENDAEKAAYENNYANIWNVWSEYDIVTFAPFKNWNFTYFGKTKNIDVYNADKKAKMLEFLKETNEAIYDLYTADNSSADPDNFTAVNFALVDGQLTFAPANPDYDIPTTQKAFLEDRVQFVIDNLIPGREAYVDENYQLALQRVMSLYFGLDGDEGSALLGGMSENAMMLAGVYYCYFLSDCYLTEDTVVALAPVLLESIAYVEAYYQGMVEADPTLAETAWYLLIKEVLDSDTYKELKEALAVTVTGTLVQSVPAIRATIEDFATQMTADALVGGIQELQLEDEAERAELIEALTADEVTKPLSRLIVYLLFGCDGGNVFEAFSLENKHVATAATFLYNAGRYMRVHNNEILLSWLRTEDSYYLEAPHIHSYVSFSDATHHGYACACGAEQEKSEHVFGEWKETKAPTEDTVGTKERSCFCGYTQYEQIPKTMPLALIIVLISSISVVAVGGAVTAVVLVKKRKKAK